MQIFYGEILVIWVNLRKKWGFKKTKEKLYKLSSKLKGKNSSIIFLLTNGNLEERVNINFIVRILQYR